MVEYTQQNTLRIAKRFQNAKRSYLLVNPLQAKHIPVSPTEALSMMQALGDRLAERYPETKLVIGFAETATAIGAAVASRMGDGCVYLQTTREAAADVNSWVLFAEEHSHAVEQKLCADCLPRWIEDTSSILFVDDEISTGKTLLNMIGQLRERYPALAGRQLAAASLLNGLSEENLRRLSGAGVACEWLVKLQELDAAGAVEGLSVEEAPAAQAAQVEFSQTALDCGPLPDPRRGVLFRDYQASCVQMARAFAEDYAPAMGTHVVVLGTEECMYPALALGKALEEQGLSVRCHATTRSPIGLCRAPGYPIVSGRKLKSFYDEERGTYLYNLSPCDAVVVVTDAPFCALGALRELAGAWKPYTQKLFMIQGGQHVWYI